MGWQSRGLCQGDLRYTERGHSESELDELQAKCHRCPVEARCLLWAKAQTQPVGFAVAGGRRWKAWNHCSICGRKIRGLDRCNEHTDIDDPAGLVTDAGEGRELRISDEH